MGTLTIKSFIRSEKNRDVFYKTFYTNVIFKHTSETGQIGLIYNSKTLESLFICFLDAGLFSVI